MEEENTKMYELGYLLVNPEKEAEIINSITQVEGTIRDHREATQVTLAYPIEKHTSAYFGVCYFDVDPANLEKIDAAMKSRDDVLRFLILSRTPQKDIAEKKETTEEPQKEQPTTVVAPAGAVTNEALEEKLEEILK